MKKRMYVDDLSSDLVPKGCKRVPVWDGWSLCYNETNSKNCRLDSA